MGQPQAFAWAILPVTMSTTARPANTHKRPRYRSVSRPYRQQPSTTRPRSFQDNATIQSDLLSFVLDSDSAQWLNPVEARGDPHATRRGAKKIERNSSLGVLEDVDHDDVKGRADKKPKRKPHGYWNDLNNVLLELEAVNAALGRKGKHQMPRLAEMKALGRGDLIAALAKYGGAKKVAAMLRWGPIRKTAQKLPTALRPNTRLPYTGVRVKDQRRALDHWGNITTLQAELRNFIADFGLDQGIMPTQKMLREKGRADLLNAVSRHGGLRIVAASMNLRCTRSKATLRFDYKSFAQRVKAFSDKYCPGKMPTAAELVRNGASNIANAVAVHGGYPVVAEKLQLQLRNTEAQGAKSLWDRNLLSSQLREFTKQHYPELALGNHMPTEREMRKFGRNDLSYAVQKFGGIKTVAKMLAFSPKLSKAERRKKEIKDRSQVA